MLAPQDRPAVTQNVLRAVLGQLSDIDVNLKVEKIGRLPSDLLGQIRAAQQAAARAGVVMVFWYDPNTGQVNLVLKAAAVERLVTRKVTTAGEEGRYEAVAIVVRATLRSHLQGTSLGVRLASARAPLRRRPPPRRQHPRAPLPSATAARRPRVSLEVAYGAEIYSPPEVSIAQGIQLGVLVKLRRHWSLLAGYRLEAPIRVENDEAGIDLVRHLIDLGGALGWRFGRLELQIRATLSLAVVSRRTHINNEGVWEANPGPDVLFGLAAHARIGFRVTPRVLAVLAFGIRSYFVNERYVTHDGSTLVSPWVVQPSFLLGLQVDLY